MEEKNGSHRQDITAAKDMEQQLHQAFEAVRLQLEAEAKSRYAKALEDAKYEFDFAQSVVGEKKWDYERALYAYEKAQSCYKQYKKDNWRFWQWKNSPEHQKYLDEKCIYDKQKDVLEQEEHKMNAAELAFERMASSEIVDRYVEEAVEKARHSEEYHRWQAAQEEVLRLTAEQ